MFSTLKQELHFIGLIHFQITHKICIFNGHHHQEYPNQVNIVYLKCIVALVSFFFMSDARFFPAGYEIFTLNESILNVFIGRVLISNNCLVLDNNIGSQSLFSPVRKNCKCSFTLHYTLRWCSEENFIGVFKHISMIWANLKGFLGWKLMSPFFSQ